MYGNTDAQSLPGTTAGNPCWLPRLPGDRVRGSPHRADQPKAPPADLRTGRLTRCAYRPS